MAREELQQFKAFMSNMFNKWYFKVGVLITSIILVLLSLAVDLGWFWLNKTIFLLPYALLFVTIISLSSFYLLLVILAFYYKTNKLVWILVLSYSFLIALSFSGFVRSYSPILFFKVKYPQYLSVVEKLSSNCKCNTSTSCVEKSDNFLSVQYACKDEFSAIKFIESGLMDNSTGFIYLSHCTYSFELVKNLVKELTYWKIITYTVDDGCYIFYSES